MTASSSINSLGLLLDIAGVAMIWRFGLPETMSRDGAIYLVAEQTDAAEKARAARYDVLSKIGLALLIGGFALQVVSNFV